MPRKCSVCIHEKVNDIDKAIASGESYSGISRRYGVSNDAVERHVKSGHIAKKIKKAKETKEIKSGLSILERLKQQDETLNLALSFATDRQDPNSLCKVVHEKRDNLILEGKLTGEINDKLEITGKDGGPIEHKVEIDLSERMKKYEHLFNASE